MSLDIDTLFRSPSTPKPNQTTFTCVVHSLTTVPWVEQRYDGGMGPWRRARHLSQLLLSMSLPWVERRQEGRLLLWRRARHTPQYPPSDSHTALKQIEFRQCEPCEPKVNGAFRTRLVVNVLQHTIKQIAGTSTIIKNCYRNLISSYSIFVKI